MIENGSKNILKIPNLLGEQLVNGLFFLRFHLNFKKLVLFVKTFLSGAEADKNLTSLCAI